MILFSQRTFVVVLLLSFSISAVGAHAAGRTVTTGILYPTTPDAVAINPASLADEGGGRGGRIAYDNPANGYAVMYADSKGNSGKGIALNAANLGELTLGTGFNFGGVRLGANLSLPELNPLDGDIGLGFIMGGSSGIRFGLMMSSLIESGSNHLTLGVGTAAVNSYQAEFNLRALLSSYGSSGQPYTQTTKAIKYFSKWGIGGLITSNIGIISPGLSNINFGVLLQFSWSGSLSFDLQYISGGDPAVGFGLIARF